MASIGAGRLRWLDPWPLALGLLALGFLAPALQTGYWAEDVVLSLVPGEQQVLGLSLLERAGGWLRTVLRLGRFAPLNPLLQVTVHGLVPSLWWYKALSVLATALDVVLFHALVRRLSREAGLATLAALLALGGLQFRVFSDPILAYHAQMPVVTAAVLGSLLTLQIGLETGRRRWRVLSVLSLAVAALTYEVTYPVVLLHLLLIARVRPAGGDRLRLAAPFVILIGLCGLATLVVRRLYPSDFYIHHADVSPGAYLTGLVRQTVAALPLSYRLIDPHRVFAAVLPPGALVRGLLRGPSLPITLGTLALTLVALNRRPAAGDAAAPGGAGLGFLAGLGALLAVLPALLIAASPFHRSLPLGLGWIQVLCQSFGVALTLACLAWAAVGRTGSTPGPRRWGRELILALAVPVLVGTTYGANRIVALAFNAPPGSRYHAPIAADHVAAWHYPRLNLEAALHAGLLTALPPNATLELAHPHPVWHTPPHAQYFYAMHSGRTLALRTPGERSPRPGSIYRLRDVCVGQQSGFVVLSPCDPAVRDEPVRLFVRDPRLTRPAGRAHLQLRADGPTPWLQPLSGVPVLAQGPDWLLLALDPAAGPIDPEALRVEPAPPGTGLDPALARSLAPGSAGVRR